MKTKKKLLLLWMWMFLLNVAAGRDCSSNKMDKTLFTVMLRISDGIGSFLPADPITPLLWMWYDLSDEGGKSVDVIIQCHIANYHNDRLWSMAVSYKERIENARTCQELKSIKNHLENPNMLGEMLVTRDNLKAAIWPVLPFWARLHIHLYRCLIQCEGPVGHLKYTHKHDEYVEFYAKLILRYWKPFRETLIQDRYEEYRGPRYPRILYSQIFSSHLRIKEGYHGTMYGSGKYDWSEPNLQVSPAENLLRNWVNYPILLSSQQRIRKLLDSCIVKKGSRVMFRKLDGNASWLSCWDAEHGEKCHWSNCPEDDKPTFKPGYHYGYDCRGEMFQIFGDRDTIEHTHVVNLNYITLNGRGLWLSRYDYHRYITRPCPGNQFHYIRTSCDKENWTIKKRGDACCAKMQLNTIYDGNVVQLHDKSWDFIIHKEDAETNNHNRVEIPSLGYF